MEFRILGPLSIVDGGREVELGRARERAVLSVLLLHANRVVSRDSLIDSLWGEDPPVAARNSLSVRITTLRKLLGGDRIVSQPPGYLVRVEPHEFDLARFERMVSPVSPTARQLSEALALWRGEPLAEFADESWAWAYRARLDELYMTVLEMRIDADLAGGRHSQLAGELRALIDEHPLRERLRGQLMLALYRDGRQAEALSVYREARAVLIDDLGIEPNPTLQQLEQSILRQDPELELSQPGPSGQAILVAPLADESFESLLGLATIIARNPTRELILCRPASSTEDIEPASATLNGLRAEMIASGLNARVAVFRSRSPGLDLARVATEQDVDLVVVDAPPDMLADRRLADLLDAAPCDVAVVVTPVGGDGAGDEVFVPFTGADHDWSAVEIGVWIAQATGCSLRIAGPAEPDHDSSRLLASASLAIQRGYGVAVSSTLVEPSPEALSAAAHDAAMVVAGLSDRWKAEGLGPTRAALVAGRRQPVVLVRSGLRPGGLAPRTSHTRFTWSIRPAI